MSTRRIIATLTSALLTVTLAAAPSQAADDIGIASAGVLEIEGNGYGHGRGMSQWGARGAAVSGLQWQQILAFYYRGTSLVDQGVAPIRVLISDDSDQDTRVVPAPGLALRSGTASAVLPAGDVYDAWRLRRVDGALVLERLDADVWTPHPAPVPLADTAGFTTTSGLVRVVLPNGTLKELRGEARSVPYKTGSRTIAVLSMEEYLRAVVPAEMPASWPADALRSQAVAARTYASRLRAGAGAAAWDTCDTVSCQVFAGTARYRADGSLISRSEHPATDAAIRDTAGHVLHYTPTGGRPTLALTEFSASSGGWTASGGSWHPYLVEQADPYDGVVASSSHAWTTSVPVSTVESRQPAIGRLLRIDIDSRTGGGRVVSATLTGTSGTVRLTGAQLRSTLGTKSDWLSFVGRDRVAGPFSRDWSGDDRADVVAVDGAGGMLLYQGSGTGGFVSKRQIGHGWSGLDQVTQVGDWDGDGRRDLVARVQSNGDLRLYRGNGAGGFLARADIGTGWDVMDSLLGVGDWDGDGADDILARRADNGSLWLYPGDGLGGFTRRTQVGNGWEVMDALVAVGDWDGDGANDLVARRGDGTLWLYPGSGTGGFGRKRQIGVGWSVMTALLGPGDWDGDGDADILARSSDGGLHLYRGNGRGGFDGRRQVGVGWQSLNLAR